MLNLLPFKGQMQIHFFIKHTDYGALDYTFLAWALSSLPTENPHKDAELYKQMISRLFLRTTREHSFADKEGSQLFRLYLHLSLNNFSIYDRH